MTYCRDEQVDVARVDLAEIVTASQECGTI